MPSGRRGELVTRAISVDEDEDENVDDAFVEAVVVVDCGFCKR